MTPRAGALTSHEHAQFFADMAQFFVSLEWGVSLTTALPSLLVMQFRIRRCVS